MVSFVAYYLHDRIVSLRGEVWAHTTSLTPPLFIDVLVPNQVMYMCVRVSTFTLFQNRILRQHGMYIKQDNLLTNILRIFKKIK
jgi:hypothetical protein